MSSYARGFTLKRRVGRVVRDLLSTPDDVRSMSDTHDGTRSVTWTALPDRETDPLRLALRHLVAGVGILFGLAVLLLLVIVGRDALDGGDVGVAVVVGVLALVGGPASLWYLLLSTRYGTERERETLRPSVDGIRLRYLPLGMLGGAVLFLSLGLQPALLLVYPVVGVACQAVVDLRYTVGRLDPETATLEQVTGARATEYADKTSFESDDRSVRTFDLSSLRRVHRLDVGSYVAFLPRYRRRGRWGRPLVLVVPADAAGRVETALDAVIRTSDWTPGGLDRPVRIALGGLGCVFLGAAGLFAVVAAERLAVLAYALATLGLVGAGMVLAALRG
jgi:hypothetical protein